ncbi:MAG: undecaprenyl/decaprenyl-phosphate alpha-N-acetylglucosaminyl 1-phosphate transferase [Spirochaetales bacterium]|nr:undecaprenyl/decaprenyl-phosphate alpha-N-acetylglucosaminyl 1-phosphate transferase [Spirochaetales bacterium]
MILVSLLSAAISLAVSVLLMPLILRLAHHRKWYDAPNRRKIHTALIPRLGGPGMFLATVAATAIASALSRTLTDGRFAPQLGTRVVFLLAGVLVMHLVGLYDDFRNLKAPFKFLLQLLAAAVVAGGGFLIRTLTLPYLGTISLGWGAYPVTVVWIIAITNAVNLIDGMDGLAGGIACFAALAMGVVAFIQGAGTTAVLCFALLGSVVGFLIFNYPPAKIFMGDSGSYFLGFTLAVLPLLGGISKASAFGSLLVPITLLTVPIVDTVMAVVRRLKEKRSVISPDKEHVHHKLLAMGLTERQILAVIYGFCAYLAVVSVSSVMLPREIDVYLIVVVWVGSLLAAWLLYFVGARTRSAASGGRTEDDEEPPASSASGGRFPRRD